MSLLGFFHNLFQTCIKCIFFDQETFHIQAECGTKKGKKLLLYYCDEASRRPFGLARGML